MTFRASEFAIKSISTRTSELQKKTFPLYLTQPKVCFKFPEKFMIQDLKLYKNMTQIT